jgi:hypothetical protein
MSSYLIAAPEALATASADLTGIGEAIRKATSAAAPSTTSVVAAAEDEVSALISKLFGSEDRYGRTFRGRCSRAPLHLITTWLLLSVSRAASEVIRRQKIVRYSSLRSGRNLTTGLTI